MKAPTHNNQENGNNKLPKKEMLTHKFQFGEDSWLTYTHIVDDGKTDVKLVGYVKDDSALTKYYAYTEPVSKDFFKETILFLSKNKFKCHFNPYYSITDDVILYYNQDDLEVKKLYIGERDKFGYEDEDYNIIEFSDLYNKTNPPQIFNKILLRGRNQEISEIRLDLYTLKKAFMTSVDNVINDFIAGSYMLETGFYTQYQLSYITAISFFNIVYDFMNKKVSKEKIIKALKGEKAEPTMETYYMENITIYYCSDYEEEDTDDDIECDHIMDFYDYSADKKVAIMMKFDYENQILYIYPHVELSDYLKYEEEKEYVEKLGNPDFYVHCWLAKPVEIGTYLSIKDGKLVLNVGEKYMVPLCA
ncbi:MAG: hypothetical protein QXF12_03690 [Candidatus Aenigmatarchaeota archaeon]